MGKKKKKKDDSEDASEDEQDESAPLGLPPLEEEKKQSGKKKKSRDSSSDSKPKKSRIPPEVSIEFEKINAQVEALGEMRGMFNERMSTISEQIGELRTMIVDQEQEFSELEAKSAKATEIVTQIEPEKFLENINKLDMRIEALKGKLESNESVNSMIMKELKEQRSRMALFKGIEDTIKLNQEVREELTTIKKIESTVEAHSNKVESIFLQVQKRFNEFDKFKGMAEDLDAGFKEQTNEFNSIKSKFAEVVKSEDLANLKTELTGVMDNFAKRLVDIEKIAANMNELVTNKRFSEFKEQNLKVLKEHQKAIAGLKDIRERLDTLTQQKEELPDVNKLKKIFAPVSETDELKQEIDKMRNLMTYGFDRVQQMESRMFVEKETYEMIRQLIKKYLEKGYTKTQIVDAFENQGWPKSLIRQYIQT